MATRGLQNLKRYSSDSNKRLLQCVVVIVCIVFVFHQRNACMHFKTTYIDMSDKRPYTGELVVCTWYDDAIREYGDITATINKRFCDKFGYTFIRDSTRRLSNRHPAWECLALVQTLLKHHSTVMWIDADACLMTEHHNILTSILNQTSKHVVFSQECSCNFCLPNTSDTVANTGVFIMHNTATTHKLLEDWIAFPHFHNTGLWEQSALNEIWRRQRKRLSKHVDFVPFGTLQGFAPVRRVEPRTIAHFNCARPEALALHMPGTSKKERVETFETILQDLNKVEKIKE